MDRLQRDAPTLDGPPVSDGPPASEPSGQSARAFVTGALVAGKYRVEEVIARGGVGVVVRATHVGLDATVAIKYLRHSALKEIKVVERFEREARLAAQIASEHVVRVTDVGRLESGPFMVMEYLQGRSLGAILTEGPPPVPRAIDYVVQACDALAEAHAVGIIHRDIKPDNLFLAQRPSNTAIVKVLDFGISKKAPRQGEDGDWKRQTGDKEFFGTPAYMSPEQLRSTGQVDQRTDVWSLGVVLYELIVATTPFDDDNLPALCSAILKDPPRPMPPEIPGDLQRVIFTCLEKDPSRRYRNVAELAQDLAPFGLPETAGRVPRIKNVVRRGGLSVRPSTLNKAPVPQVKAATESGLSAETVLVRPAKSLGLRTLIAAFAGVIVVAGIGVLVARSGTPRASASPQPAAATPTLATAAAIVASASAVPSDAPMSSAPAASAAAPATTASNAEMPVAKPDRHTHPRAPAAVDPRALFGGRK